MRDLRVTTRAEKAPLGNVLYRLIVEYRIQFGLELAESDEAHEEYAFSPYLNVGRLSNTENYVLITGRPPVKYKAESRAITISAVNERLEAVMDELVSQMGATNGKSRTAWSTSSHPRVGTQRLKRSST